VAIALILRTGAPSSCIAADAIAAIGIAPSADTDISCIPKLRPDKDAEELEA
jgi:hypothetical protein